MQPGYSFEPDPKRGLLRIRLHGFFSPEEVARFEAEKQVAIRSLRCAPNQHLTLVDLSGCRIQSREVFEAFAAMVGDPATMARRIALVVGGSLARMQARRTLNRPDAQCFDDVASAEAWLFEREPDATDRSVARGAAR